MGTIGILLFLIGLGWISYRFYFGKLFDGFFSAVTPYILTFIGLMSIGLGDENHDVQSSSSNVFIAFSATYILVLIIFLVETWKNGILNNVTNWILIGIGIVLFVIGISI